MMDKENIIYLLKKHQEKTVSQEERAAFSSMLQDKDHEILLKQIFDDYWSEITDDEITQVQIPSYHQILQEIKLNPQIRRTNRLWFRMAIAAMVTLVLGIFLYRYTAPLTTRNSELLVQNDIPPGKNGATLTLANGKKIYINDALAGNIADESGVKISKTKDGQIVYEVVQTEGSALNYNTLSTTRGEQTQVRLQDGSLVYLNAETSLTYPTSFSKQERRKVALVGEAYFEIAKDKEHPFVVESNDQLVEVLGTTFNITNYEDESIIKTTLLEGSVRISNKKSNSTGVLKPGEQATVAGNTTVIKNVEVDDVVAWKNGYFMFDNETLATVMKKVSRWYKVEVEFKNESLKRKTFFGSVGRFENISALLKLLQQTNIAEFEIKGNKIIVSQ